MSIVTDATPVDQPKTVEGNVLFEIYSLFLDKSGKEDLKERFLTPGLRYGDVKKELFETIWEYFLPYRSKRDIYANDKGEINKILQEGAKKARQQASYYLDLARKNVGLNYME